jgi:hypothetical protein
MSKHLVLNIREVTCEQASQAILQKVIEGYCTRMPVDKVFFAFHSPLSAPEQAIDDASETAERFYIASEDIFSPQAASLASESESESESAAEGVSESKGEESLDHEVSVISAPLLEMIKQLDVDTYFSYQTVVAKEIDRLSRLMPRELAKKLYSDFETMDRWFEERRSSLHIEKADSQDFYPLIDLWREAPMGFTAGVSSLMWGEVGVVKQLLDGPDSPNFSHKTLLVRELLGAHAYQILGVNFADSFLYGLPSGELSLQKEFIEGERLLASGESLHSSPFDGVSPQELAIFTLSGALIGDIDFCGLNEYYQAGHNFRVQGSHLYGFDADHAFTGNDFLLLFLEDLGKPFALVDFLEWINALIFTDTENSFLKSGESCPPELLDIRKKYSEQGITKITQANLIELIKSHATGDAPKHLLWNFLISPLFSGSTSLKSYSFLRQFNRLFDPYVRAVKKGDPAADTSLAMLGFLKNVVKFRSMTSMLSRVTPEDWMFARRHVLARVPHVLELLEEAELPEALLPRSVRESYLKIVNNNAEYIRGLSLVSPRATVGAGIGAGMVGALMQGTPPVSPVADVEAVPAILGKRLYYPADFEVPFLATAGQGASAVVFTNQPLAPAVLEFKGIFKQKYDARKGWGRRLFKSSYSQEMSGLKAFLESSEHNHEVSWQDVEQKIMAIFAETLQQGGNPFDWKKLSNRTLWMFLMEAHYQIELQPVKQHAEFRSDSLEKGLWDKIYAVQQQREPAASNSDGSVSREGSSSVLFMPKPAEANSPALNLDRFDNQLARIAKVANFYPRLRRQSPAEFEGFLRVLSSDIAAWKKEHVKWYHLGRRIFGIRGIRRILQKVKNRELTPTEILSQVNAILTDRIQHGKHQDTKNLYNNLKAKITSRVGYLEDEPPTPKKREKISHAELSEPVS